MASLYDNLPRSYNPSSTYGSEASLAEMRAAFTRRLALEQAGVDTKDPRVSRKLRAIDEARPRAYNPSISSLSTGDFADQAQVQNTAMSLLYRDLGLRMPAGGGGGRRGGGGRTSKEKRPLRKGRSMGGSGFREGQAAESDAQRAAFLKARDKAMDEEEGEALYQRRLEERERAKKRGRGEVDEELLSPEEEASHLRQGFGGQGGALGPVSPRTGMRSFY